MERRHPQSARGGARHTAQALDPGLQGLQTHPEEPQAAPDILAREMLDVIIFIHFLFSKIRVNIQYIVYIY